MKKIVFILVTILMILTGCLNNSNSYSVQLEDNDKIAYVIIDYSNVFSSGEDILNESLDDFEAISQEYSIDLIVSEFNDDYGIDITNIESWIMSNKDSDKVIIIEQRVFEILDASQRVLETIRQYNNLTIGVISRFCPSNRPLPENIDYIVYCNTDESYGRATAKRCSELFNGKSGYIILDRNATSGLSGAVYYQHYFVDEFENMSKQYELSNIHLIYEGELISSSEDEKVNLIKNARDLLAVVEGYSSTDWDYVLRKANITDVQRFLIGDNLTSNGKFESYVFDYQEAIIMATNYAFDILNGNEIPSISLYGCKRLNL